MDFFRCGKWTLLLLYSILLLALSLVIGVSIDPLVGLTPTAFAGSKQDNLPYTCSNDYHMPSVNKAIVIDTDVVVCDSITTFGGTIALNGEVKGNVIAFKSDIVITGTVDGDVTLYGGSIILQNGSHVHGDIRLYGAHWVRDDHSQLDGSIISNDHIWPVGLLFPGNESFTFPFWPIIVWVALGLLLTSLLPEHVMLVRVTATSKTRRSLSIGLLSILLAPPLLLVLFALIVSIPLAIIIILGLVAAWALGTVAIGWYAGEYILRKVAPQHNTRPLQVVVGLVGLVLLSSIPFIGWLISLSAGLLGLGAVFLSRFGTRLYTPPRQPLSL